MVFFGAAGLIVGLLVATGLGGPLWAQILGFTLLSVASLLVLRGPLVRRMKAGAQTREIDTLVGQEVVLMADLAPGGVGQAELRGTVWEARTRETSTLRQGERCVVAEVDGLSLWLQAAPGRREGVER